MEAWIHLERPVSFLKKLSELVSAHTSLDLKRLNFRSRHRTNTFLLFLEGRDLPDDNFWRVKYKNELKGEESESTKFIFKSNFSSSASFTFKFLVQRQIDQS